MFDIKSLKTSDRNYYSHKGAQLPYDTENENVKNSMNFPTFRTFPNISERRRQKTIFIEPETNEQPTKKMVPCAWCDDDDNGWALDARQRRVRRWWARGWGCSPGVYGNDDGWSATTAVDSSSATVAVVVADLCVPRGIDTPPTRRHLPLSLRPLRRNHPRLEPPQSACWRNNTSRTFIRRELNTTACTPPHCCHHWR